MCLQTEMAGDDETRVILEALQAGRMSAKERQTAVERSIREEARRLRTGGVSGPPSHLLVVVREKNKKIKKIITQLLNSLATSAYCTNVPWHGDAAVVHFEADYTLTTCMGLGQAQQRGRPPCCNISGTFVAVQCCSSRQLIFLSCCCCIVWLLLLLWAALVCLLPATAWQTHHLGM